MNVDTDVLDPEGVARGDYFVPETQAAAPAPPPAPPAPPAGGDGADGPGDLGSPAAGDAGDPTPAGETHQDPDPGAESGDGKAVPYSRFKDAINQKNTAQARIAELEARLAAAVPAAAAPAAAAAAPDKVAELIEARAPLYVQVEEARLDGETKLASELQQKIDDLNAEILLEKSTAASKKTVAIDREAQRYEGYIDQLEATYPQFRSDAPEFNRDLILSINETAEAFEAKGYSPTSAMQRAVAMHQHHLASSAKPAAPSAAAPPAASPAAKPDVAKSVETINKQPADMSRSGENRDTATINVAELSEEDFEKLPESTRAKLRGDHLK